MLTPPPPPQQCGTVSGRSSYSSLISSSSSPTSLCQKSVQMFLFSPGSTQNFRTNKQRCPEWDPKNEPSYENTNFSLWTEPLWFLISPMIAAFPHQIGQRPPPSHFRAFSEGRVLLFIKRSEVSALSFLRLRRISAAIPPLPSIYRSLHLDLITHPLSAM